MMIWHYLKLSLRRMRKNLSLSLPNVLGLAFGFAFCLVILMFVLYQIQRDSQHEYRNQLHRVVRDYHPKGSASVYTTHVREDFFQQLGSQYPEVEDLAGIYRLQTETSVHNANNQLQKENLAFCTPTVFALFTLPMIHGRKELFTEPFDVILTAHKARSYFGKVNPVGKDLTVYTAKDTLHLTVKGVVNDFPENAIFAEDFFVRYPEHYDWRDRTILEEVYVLLDKRANADVVEAKFPVVEEDFGSVMITTYSLQPFKRMYFHSQHLQQYSRPQGTYMHVVILAIIGLVIFWVTLNNFILFTVFDGFDQLPNAGLRKVFGATSKDLRWLSYTHVFSYVLAGVLLALLFVPLFVQLLSHLLQVDFSASFLEVHWFALSMLGIVLVSTAFVGFYLSGYMAVQKPICLFRGFMVSVRMHIAMQKVVIIVQIVFLVGLTSFALLVADQLSFAQNLDEGYNKTNTYQITLADEERNFNQLKQTLLTEPMVAAVGGVNRPFPANNSMLLHLPEYKNPASNQVLHMLFADAGFFDVFEIPLLTSTNLSERDLLINRQAAKVLNLPINETDLQVMEEGGRIYSIKAVCENFNFRGIQHRQLPMALMIRKRPYSYMLVRMNSQGGLQQLRKCIGSSLAEEDYEINSISQESANRYGNAFRLLSAIQFGAVLVMLVTTLGLFNVMLLTLKKHARGLAIRKVLGMGGRSMLTWILKDFVYLFLLGVVLAIPVVLILINQWLTYFVERTSIEGWVFVVAALLGFVVLSVTALLNVINLQRVRVIDVLRVNNS